MSQLESPVVDRPVSQVPPRRGGFRPREYAHVVFQTAQPQALSDWYCAVLGMQPVMVHPLIRFLTWDDSQDRLAIITAADAKPRSSEGAGFHHVAFSVNSLKELVGQYRFLKSRGIEPHQCMNHGVATSMYYRDPDGNQIELSVEAFGSVEALNEWLATGAFDANPVGIPLDPEELTRRVESGEDERALLRPAPDHAERLARTIAEMKV